MLACIKISELTLDPVIDCPWSLVGKLMISRFPSFILKVSHVLIFMQHVSFLGIWVIVCYGKGLLFCFRGKHVHMRCHHHIDMFHTHFMHPCHEGCCIKKGMCYTFCMVYVVALSVRV